MKIHLITNQEELNGYININALQEDVSNLDKHVMDTECTELITNNTINYIPQNQITQVLNHWISKLRHGATISISSLDIYQVCRSHYNMSLNTSDVINLIYGGTPPKISVLSMKDLSDFLTQRKLKILKKRATNYESVIIARRP